MECNKEEAYRAKTIAEKKMQANDFVGAHKFALKAQKLYGETENISQMICICDVHRSAESKISGNDMDLYEILQIEHTADDALIKKQYRKLALLLHPDKNNFSGAESAFKLIGEAQRVLLDREKRSIYDMKRRSYKPAVRNQASKQTPKASNAKNRPSVQKKSVNNPSSNQQPNSGATNGGIKFWTRCPFCSFCCQFYKEFQDKTVCCQCCRKPFAALNIVQSTQPRSNTTQPVFPQNDASNVRVSKAEYEAVNQTPIPNCGSQAKPSKSEEARQTNKGSENVHSEQEQGSQPSKSEKYKKEKKFIQESSESYESDSSLDSEDLEVQSDTLKTQQFDNAGDSHTRRSSRSKRKVSYNENASDDDEINNSPKRAKESEETESESESESGASEEEQPSSVFRPSSGSVSEQRKGECNNSYAAETVAEPMEEAFEAENGNKEDSNREITPDPTFHDYPDPEFCDFDKDREEQCFKVGQVWAAYDTVDAMPRFYARIKKVFSSRFKLKITWLEPAPVNQDGLKWVESGLPFSCGNFMFGNSESTEDRLMFSHAVCLVKGCNRNFIKIYPQKGETWALFKNWNANWYETPENERKFEYEYVEVISEYDETVGIRVVHLGKLKGFASLFCRVGGIEVQIPPTEVLRFAHMVPAYRMTGNERQDVPKGSFELDPASVGLKVEEISLPKTDGQTCVVDLSNSPEDNPSVETAKQSAPVDSDDDVEDVKEHTDSEFFDFDNTKSAEKFQVNQVWALYCDIDGLPKDFGLIKKIDPLPNFKLHLARLESCNLGSDIMLWKDEGMPISCGQFKAKGSGNQQFTLTSSFSHQLQADQTGKNNVFAIYPRKGEVWAMYKNWDPDMTSLGLKNCEYDIVEVLEEVSSYTLVLFLERVDGFNAVFKPKSYSLTLEIPRVQSLRFSHQIPYFTLTNEKDGSLRGFMELDPAALPPHILHKTK